MEVTYHLYAISINRSVRSEDTLYGRTNMRHFIAFNPADLMQSHKNFI